MVEYLNDKEEAEFMAATLAAQENPDASELHHFLCEVCGKVENLTDKDALEAGWDYPPFIGAWGVVSPRTCGDCGIDKTAWWQLTMGVSYEELELHHKVTILRITKEQGPEVVGG